MTAELFAPFPHVRLATASDGPALSAFHRAVSMKTKSMSLAYDYAADAPLDPRTFVSLFEDGGRLQGTASLTTRRTELEGRSVTYGYLGNLRIAPRMSAGIRKEWRRFYGALVAQAPSLDLLDRPEFLLTAILDENHAAIRFLTQHVKEVQYLPVQRYESITTFGPTPLARTRARGVTVRFDGGWQRVVAERQGRVVARVTPSFAPSRTLLVTEASAPIRVAMKALGVDLPGPVKLVYLTELFVEPTLRDRAQVFEAMAYFIWQNVVRLAGAQGLCFSSAPDFEHGTFDVRRWWRLRTPGTLYEVVARGATASALLQRAARSAPLPFDLATS